MRIPSKDYPRFQGVETLNSDMADNADIRRAIIQAVPQANSQVKDFAKHFGRNSQRETCKAIFDFLKNDIRYVADGSEQVIKLPSALLKTRVGDCKSYSLLTSAILTNLGIPHHFVLTSYNADPTPSHIYVALDDGCIIDAVWGIFDSEKKPTYKYEVKPNGKMMKVKTLSGVGKPIGNPLLLTAIATAPAIIASLKNKEKVTGLGAVKKIKMIPANVDLYESKYLYDGRDYKVRRDQYGDYYIKSKGKSLYFSKPYPKNIEGIGGCGCGCNSCGGSKPMNGIGKLTSAAKAECDKKYPVKKTLLGDTNKLLREACYASKSTKDDLNKLGDKIADLNLKKYTNSAFRTIYLGIIKFNVDGYATLLQNNPAKRTKLERQFTSWGGDGNNVYAAIKEGAARKPLKLGFLNVIKDSFSKVLPKGVRINGIGQTDTAQTMTPEEKKALYAELTKMGFEAKDWSRMSKDEKSRYISKKLTSGSIGGIIRAALDTGGAAAATAICSPMNVAAAACTPLGALLGEAMYSQIPDIVDMIVTGDKQFDPVAPTGDTPPPVVDIYDEDNSDNGGGDNTLLYIAGASVLGFILYQKFK
jgi:hypothetical protein